MRILITGATGFIGKNLVAHAFSRDYEVVALVRNGSAQLDPRVHTVMVNDLARWSATDVEEIGAVDCVVHLAGISHAQAPLEEIQRINVDATVNLAKQAAVLGAKRFVFVSSVKAIGSESEAGEPFVPNSICNPDDAYGLSKLRAERELQKLALEISTDIVIVRPPVVYGQRAAGNFHLLATAIRAGLPLPLRYANAPRSHVSIDNLCEFLLVCATSGAGGAGGARVLHVADGPSVTTAELTKDLGRAVGRSPRLVGVRPGLVKWICTRMGRPSIYQSLFGRLEVSYEESFATVGWTPSLTRKRAIESYFGRSEMTQSRSIMLLDKALAGCVLVISSPAWALISLAGYLDTGSPFFVQDRVGKNEQTFKVIKFRTMSLDTADLPTHLAPQQSVTRSGRFLRASKLDELPQLINVLRGEMSFVGPRPCLPSQEELRFERRARGLHTALPGITGLGQIAGIDMSTPIKLAVLDAKMMKGLGVRTYFWYILLTAIGRGYGDRVNRVIDQVDEDGPELT